MASEITARSLAVVLRVSSGRMSSVYPKVAIQPPPPPPPLPRCKTPKTPLTMTDPHALLASGEMALDVVDQLVRSNAVDMVVVDSVAALVPRAELEGEMADMQMGLQARLMSKVGVAHVPRVRKRGQTRTSVVIVAACGCTSSSYSRGCISQTCSSPRWMCLSYVRVLMMSAARTAPAWVCS